MELSDYAEISREMNDDHRACKFLSSKEGIADPDDAELSVVSNLI